MHIQLTRPMKTKRYRGKLEIYIKAEAPEVFPFILLASENNDTLSPEIIKEKFLPTFPIQAGINVIEELKRYGILDDKNTLTVYANEILKKFRETKEEMIFKFQGGVYEFHIIEDVFYSNLLLTMEPYVYKGNELKNEVDCPDSLNNMVNKAISAFWHEKNGLIKDMEKTNVLMKSLPPKLEVLESKVNLTLLINLTPLAKPTLKVQGDYNFTIPTPTNLGFTAVFKELLGSQFIDWKEVDGIERLYIPFDDTLTDLEKSKMVKTRHRFQTNTLGPFGEFETCEAFDIPIYPLTEQDLKSWVSFILDEKFKAQYIDDAIFSEIQQVLKKMFPSMELNFRSLSERSQASISQFKQEFSTEDLLKMHIPKQFWHVQAVLDLS